jgi:hypothetical protein
MRWAISPLFEREGGVSEVWLGMWVVVVEDFWFGFAGELSGWFDIDWTGYRIWCGFFFVLLFP